MKTKQNVAIPRNVAAVVVAAVPKVAAQPKNNRAIQAAGNDPMNQKQHKDATEQIWRGLSDRLRRFVRLRINATADVDDVLQSVFLQIHSHLNDLRKADRLESWVFQITRNAVAEYFRKKPIAQESSEIPNDSRSPGDKNKNAELAGCLNSLIERLPEDQRRALTLYELEGISQKDIAVRESISLSGAKSRIQRGRKTLEETLKACCEFQFDRRGNVVDYDANNPECCDDKCG